MIFLVKNKKMYIACNIKARNKLQNKEPFKLRSQEKKN